MLGTALTAPMWFTTPVAAQTAPAAEDEQSVIVVTGTYLGGQTENGVLPIDVTTTDELEARGLDSPLEFIKTLPSVGPVLGDSNQYTAGGSQGVGSINLRSLGRERTLVLFNGRRWMSEPGDGAGDTNLIPMFALQRIEVLKDGAASTYGSDAIAGVANFVSRKDFNGLEAKADWQFVDGSNDNYQFSILGGKTFGSVNFLVGAGYQHRSELPTVERAFTQVPYAVNPSGWSFLSNPGTYIPKVGPMTAGAAGTSLGIGVDGNLLNACTSLGGVSGTFPSGTSNFPTCRYFYVPFVNLIEKEDRYQVFAQMDADLSDRTSFHVEAMYAHTEVPELGYSPSYPPTSGPLGPGSTQAFFIPRSNPGFNTFLAQTFPAGSPAYLATYASALFLRPYALGGFPLDDRGAGEGAAFNDAWRVSAGFEHQFGGGLKGQLYGTFFRNHRRAFSYDTIGTRFQAALQGLGGPNCTGTTPGANGCLYFNPFINSAPRNPSLGLTNPAYVTGLENSPAIIEWIRAQNGVTQHEDQFIVDGVVSGDFSMFGTNVAFAVGGQYRGGTFVNHPINQFSDPNAVPCAKEGTRSCLDNPFDKDYPTGPFIFLGQYPAANLSQNVYAVFAEAKVNPFEALEVIGAVRFEDYGGKVGSTINPKLSAKLQPTPWLGFRGSVGTTFRGPLPSDLSPGGVSAVAGITAAGNAFKSTDTVGNPDLDPETALTYSVGALLEFGGLNFSVDYWTYEFEGRFTTLPIQAIATAVAPGTPSGQQKVDCASPFAQFITFAGGTCTATTIANDIARIRTQTVNGPDVKTRGLDFNLTYRDSIGPARVSLGAAATHVIDYKFSDFVYQGLTFSKGYEAAGFTNYDRAPFTVSKWRGNAYASVQIDPVGLNYNMTYIGGVDDNRCPALPAPCTTTPEFGGTNFGRRVRAYMQHDVQATLEVPVAGATVQFTAGIENLFDRAPSAARVEYSYDPFLGTALGRTFRLGTKVKL